MCISAIWSMSALPSAFVNSSGWGMGCAAARQCLQARSQDCVTSQMARKGDSSKSIPPRAGMLCIGCIRPPAESRRAGATIPIQKNSFDAPWAVIKITFECIIWPRGFEALDKIGKREHNFVTCRPIRALLPEWKAESVEQGWRIEKSEKDRLLRCGQTPQNVQRFCNRLNALEGGSHGNRFEARLEQTLHH